MISWDLLFSFYLDLYSVICGLFDDRNVSGIQSRLLRCADLRRVHFAKKRIFSSLWAWFATVSSSQFSHMGWRSSFANDDVQHCSKSFQNFLVEAAFVLAHVPVHVSQGRARAQDAENCRFSLGIIVKTLLLYFIRYMILWLVAPISFGWSMSRPGTLSTINSLLLDCQWSCSEPDFHNFVWTFCPKVTIDCWT